MTHSGNEVHPDSTAETHPNVGSTPPERPPRLFVSSTVSDFGDLRSSIKYLLEEFGFGVALSEVPGFPHPLDAPARMAALAAIDDCNYYVLLVGFRYGSSFSEGLSVTRAEYRRAKELAAQGRVRLILFARGSVLDLWRHHVDSVPESDDWPAVTDFLRELHEERPGVSNWMHRFDSFRDVADALRAALKLSGPLHRRALEANLLWELRANIKACHYARRGHAARATPTTFTSDSVPEPSDPDDEYELTHHQAQQLWWFWMLVPAGARGLRRSALDDAISSGDFLEYDPSLSTFRVGILQAHMLDLGERVAQFELAHRVAPEDAVFRTDLSSILAAAKRGAAGGVTVHGLTLRTLYVLRNQLWNILAQSVVLARTLAGLDAQLQLAVTVPLFPPPLDESPENDREMSEAEVDAVLSSGQAV